MTRVYVDGLGCGIDDLIDRDEDEDESNDILQRTNTTRVEIIPYIVALGLLDLINMWICVKFELDPSAR